MGFSDIKPRHGDWDKLRADVAPHQRSEGATTDGVLMEPVAVHGARPQERGGRGVCSVGTERKVGCFAR